MTKTQRDYLATLIAGTRFPTVAALLAEENCPNPTQGEAAVIIDRMRRHWGYTR